MKRYRDVAKKFNRYVKRHRQLLRGNLRLKIFAMQNKKLADVIKKVTSEHLSYLDVGALLDLVQVVINNEKKNVEGIIVEAGCALGGSAIAIASAKNKDRMFFVYDVFGMIPSPSERDGQDAHERYKVIVSGSSPGVGGKLYSSIMVMKKTFTIKFGDHSLISDSK